MPQTDISTREPGGVLWLTGLSGAGKTTLAKALKQRLTDERCMAVVLDGDVLRTGLNAGLGFSSADRRENIRRTAEVASLFKAEGFVVICALISPAAAQRKLARAIVGERFFEVHVSSDLSVCEARDPKGLYAKARSGTLAEFTGVSSPYEVPTAPDLALDTRHSSIAESLDELDSFVRSHIRLARSQG
ncbi:adenylyl-sulfate kinase [Trinickia acidisoli]|uniref:adenylyl-sulfate kinase n=1 Tax=Trinickia acidisoli TaxID=2767482 RepID=UPI001A8DBE9C|nr:adenylyl-sulfate kinase [Trinickia acidisoli]